MKVIFKHDTEHQFKDLAPGDLFRFALAGKTPYSEAVYLKTMGEEEDGQNCVDVMTGEMKWADGKYLVRLVEGVFVEGYGDDD